MLLITEVALYIILFSLPMTDIDWLSLYGPENFYGSISQDENVQEMTSQVAAIVQGKSRFKAILHAMYHFCYLHFLLNIVYFHMLASNFI